MPDSKQMFGKLSGDTPDFLPSLPYFPHIREYLTELVTKMISWTEIKFKCQVCRFVTDNATNMAKMRNELEEKGLNVLM